MAMRDRIHSITKCSMCDRESYIRMVYCVPMTTSHFLCCRECADGLIDPGRARVLRDIAWADAQELPEST
jgi:hypothetical protein